MITLDVWFSCVHCVYSFTSLSIYHVVVWEHKQLISHMISHVSNIHLIYNLIVKDVSISPYVL